jgi:integrase/recombinase XerD
MRTNKNYVSIVLDLRRPNVKGNYFVRLRVYSPQSQKTKYYNFDRFKLEQSELEIVYTILEGFKSSEDFAKVMSSIKPRGREREIKSFITKKEVEANDIYNSLDPFNFQDFEFRLLNDLKVSNSFKEFTVNHINHLEKIGNIGNAMNFRTALKSLQYYHTKINKRNELNFIDITPKWLEEYHHFMTSTSGKSETTVSIYLRALRRLFNLAIDEKLSNLKIILSTPKPIKRAIRYHKVIK